MISKDKKEGGNQKFKFSHKKEGREGGNQKFKFSYKRKNKERACKSEIQIFAQERQNKTQKER